MANKTEIETQTETSRWRVWRHLVENVGAWTPGFVLASSLCGGSEGLRRLREIRAVLGPEWIEKRKMAFSNAYEYRLKKMPHRLLTRALDTRAGRLAK